LIDGYFRTDINKLTESKLYSAYI